MRDFRRLSRFRLRRLPPLAVASLTALLFLVPVTIGGTDSAAASPSPGYTASLILTGDESEWVAVNPKTDTAYFGNLTADEVTVVDGSTSAVTETIGLPGEPRGIAVDPVTDTVYVSLEPTASNPPVIAVIDGATNTVTATITLPAGSDPFGVAVDSSTDTVYVAEQGANAVAVIDGSTNEVTATVGTGSSEPNHLAVDETTNVVWVADETGNVIAISGASNTVTQTISLSGALVEDIAADPVTDTVYAATETSGIAVIDGATGAVSATIDVTEPLFTIAVDPSTGTVFGSSFDPIGSGTTWVIDATSNSIVDTLERGGLQIAVDTETGAAYVAPWSAQTNAAWVVTPSAANAMSPVIKSTATTFTAGTAGSFAVEGSALPAATYSETGQLPSGVTLSSSGTLSGTPATGTGGVYPITITASNGIAPDYSQAFTLTVDEAPGLTVPAAATMQVGVAGSVPFQVTGYPVVTRVVLDTALPAGVVTAEPTPGSWELSGTPATGAGGVYQASFQAENGVGVSGVATMTLTVLEAPTFSSADEASFIVGAESGFSVTAAAYPAATFTESGALPAGITLAADGFLSGKPAIGTAGSYPIQVTASNSLGSATQQFTLTVVEQPFEVQASQQSGFCLDNTGGLASDGNPIQIWACQGNANQGWEYVPSVNGVAGDYQLENSNGLCLDDPNDSAVNGTKVQLWSCLGDASQQWTAVTADGIFTGYVNANGLCLDNTANAATDGNRVQVWACNGSAAQHWYGPSPQSSQIPPAFQVQASQASGFCLDNTTGLAQDGNPIQIWSCLHNVQQAWMYVPSVNGVTGDFQLQSLNYGMCLDDPNDSAVNGTRVQLWSCLGDASQTWTQVTVGSYTEYVNANGLCLDNTGNALTDGNRVEVLACSGDTAQQWFGPSPQSNA